MSDDRAVRALEDVVAVDEIAPGLARVVTWSDAYVIDARGEGCACPDKKYNDAVMCKHEHAAILADSGHLPTPFIRDIDARPTAMADGGDTCDDCAELPDGWPCATCYIEDGAEITAEGYQ